MTIPTSLAATKLHHRRGLELLEEEEEEACRLGTASAESSAVSFNSMTSTSSKVRIEKPLPALPFLASSMESRDHVLLDPYVSSGDSRYRSTDLRIGRVERRTLPAPSRFIVFPDSYTDVERYLRSRPSADRDGDGDQDEIVEVMLDVLIDLKKVMALLTHNPEVDCRDEQEMLANTGNGRKFSSVFGEISVGIECSSEDDKSISRRSVVERIGQWRLGVVRSLFRR